MLSVVAASVSGRQHVTDFCLIEFETNVTTDFCGGNAFKERTICSSAAGDRLLIFGALKEKTVIDPPDITVGYCRLEASDVGSTFDPFLRKGAAQYLGQEFSTVTGISGAPVFNLTHNRLCGMVVRGSFTAGRLSVYYAEASDILRFAEGAVERRQAYSTRSRRTGSDRSRPLRLIAFLARLLDF